VDPFYSSVWTQIKVNNLVVFLKSTTMREYHSGQIYPFEVTDIREVNERKYIYLSDGFKDTFRVPPYDYQLEWEPYNLPPILNCFVVSVNEFGLPFLAQVRKEVLDHNYTEVGSEYAFKVVAKKIDPNSHTLYFELHDVFGLTHRYYPGSNEPEREVSDIFNLVFNGIEVKDRNRAHLRLSAFQETHLPVPNQMEDPREPSFLGEENETREFKSSIVYPAGTIEPDIDRQLILICKTIAGLMNKNGGDLYIGVNDSGHVSGIHYDFPHLNSSKQDSFTYQQNQDGYENKLRTSVKLHLSNTANANVGIEFPTEGKLTYCKVKINPVLKPIYLNEVKLYERAGNMTVLLKGDEVTWFVEERFRKRMAQEGFQIATPKIENIQEIEVKELVSESSREVIVAEPQIHKTEEKVWYWMTFYASGEWSFDNKPGQARDKVYELAISTALKNERLIMAYKNGCVNVVIPYDQINPKGKNGRKLKNRGQRYKNGWNTKSEILDFFCEDRKNLLVFKSVQSDGTEWVKIHNVSDVSIHVNLNSEGNVLINQKFASEITAVKPLPIYHYHFVSSLVLKKHQTSGYIGFNRKEKSLDKVYRVLEQLLEKEA
jgi:hypothetical protein